MSALVTPASLSWTGERMVPHQADPITETFHWQRYMYFRPWYEGARIIDAASGEGYGLGYAATFSATALGYDISDQAVAHASNRYPHAKFAAADVCDVDYSEADLVLSFETIEHLPDPEKFLKALNTCKGRIVISTPNRLNHSPGNLLGDKPWNQFHTIEWTPSEFAKLILDHFPDREVRFLSQENRWPGLIQEGLDEAAKYTIAVIGEGSLPKWPSIGLSMPTVNEAQRAEEAIYSFTKYYPGTVHFAIVANGSNNEALMRLHSLRDNMPHIVTLLEEPKNIGYGQGANKGLDYLWQEGWYDLFGVTNDDVLPSVDCVSQLVCGLKELEASGQKPGIIGPVSNEVSGAQKVDIGTYSNYAEMMQFSESWHREHHSAGTQANQVRGLFMLITHDCLSDIGGFDPVYGLGNFEDDDLNLRAKLAGYTLWIIDGAFLHHAGSTTFKQLEIDYDRNIVRNLALFLEKWNLEHFEEAFQVQPNKEDNRLFVPLTAKPPRSNHLITINGEPVDLVHQASEFDLAAWIVTCLRDKPREARTPILDALQQAA